MEEIAKNIFIEKMYPGMTFGALKLEDGLFLVDAPLRNVDVQSWRTKLHELGEVCRTMLLMLDTHIDRTLGIRGLNVPILAHQNAVEILSQRSSSIQIEDLDGYAEYQSGDVPEAINWVEPDLTYSSSISVYWAETPLVVAHRAGSHYAGSWLRDDEEKVMFVGDSVMTQYPPFLAWADLDQWLSDLIWLRTGTFSDYTIISSRQGIVDHDTVESMIDFITEIKSLVDALATEEKQPEKVAAAVSSLLGRLNLDEKLVNVYRDRVIWGLERYLHRHANQTGKVEQGVE